MFCHINIGSHLLHILSTFFISRQLRNSLYLSWYFCALRIILQSCLESSQSLHNTWRTLGISAVEYQKSCGPVHTATRSKVCWSLNEILWRKSNNNTFSHLGFNVIVVSASARALLSLTNCRNAAARLLKKWNNQYERRFIIQHYCFVTCRNSAFTAYSFWQC